MTQIHYVGITGRAKQGKSTVALSFLRQAGKAKWLRSDGAEARLSFLHCAISEPMKEMWFEQIVGTGERGLARTIEDLKDTPYDELDGIEHRAVLESLGDWGRGIHEYFWIHAIPRKVQSTGTQERDGTIVLIPDVRFEAEARWIRDRGGVIVHVVGNRPGITSTHSVESMPIDIHQQDRVIGNFGPESLLEEITTTLMTSHLDKIGFRLG
jgi:hypothetical protein